MTHATARRPAPGVPPAPARDIPVWGRVWFAFDHQIEAGLVVYYASLAGLVACHYLTPIPAWIGFLTAYLASSILATIVHDPEP